MTSFQNAEPSVAFKYCARSDNTVPDAFGGRSATEEQCSTAVTQINSRTATGPHVRSGSNWKEDEGSEDCAVHLGPRRSAVYEGRQSVGLPTLLGHRKLESTVRYLGIEVDDGVELSEQLEI